MKATINRVTEPISIAFKSSNSPVAMNLNVGDVITWQLGDYTIQKGAANYYIPNELMQLIKTEPLPTLDVSWHPKDGDHVAVIYVNDFEHFSSEEIAQKVKEAIDKNKRIIPQKATTE